MVVAGLKHGSMSDFLNIGFMENGFGSFQR